MTENQKIDLIMGIIYETKGMVYVIPTLKELGIYMNEIELKSILLTKKDYMVFQTSRQGIRVCLTPNGEDFVQNDSFSEPGIPVIALDFDLPCT